MCEYLACYVEAETAFQGGPSGQPGPSDEGCSQASTCSLASSSSCSIFSDSPARQPCLTAQMATATARVAVGSAVGPTLGHAITGGFSGGGNAQPAWHHLPGAPGSPAVRPGILWALLSRSVSGVCPEPEQRQTLQELQQGVAAVKNCKQFNLINKFKLKNWNGLYIIDSASSDPE